MKFIHELLSLQDIKHFHKKSKFVKVIRQEIAMAGERGRMCVEENQNSYVLHYTVI